MNNAAHFGYCLRQGQIGESLIARWLMDRGNSISPVYEKQIDSGKGPQFFCHNGSFAAPDLLVFPAVTRGGVNLLWAEAKHKTVFSWYRNGRPGPYWCTGIDLHHYRDYLAVQKRSRVPVWLFFLHVSSMPSADDLARGCPPTCPTGLFANSLDRLETCISHTSERHGRHGMVYWRESDLRRFASYEEIATGSEG